RGGAGRRAQAFRREVDEPARSPAAQVDVLKISAVIASRVGWVEPLRDPTLALHRGTLGLAPLDPAYEGVFRRRKSRVTGTEYALPSFFHCLRNSMRGARRSTSSEIAAGCAVSLPGISSVGVVQPATKSRVTLCTNSVSNSRAPSAITSASAS